MRIKLGWTSIIGAAIFLIASPAMAQIPSWGIDEFKAPPDARWSPIAIKDVDAAYELLRDNHPGAAPELHDVAFQQRLENAHVRALERARTVTSYQGYIFVLEGFATDMGDKHIWSRPDLVVNLPRWAEMIVSKRGTAWVITDTEPDQKALLGATLLSCDEISVEDLARTNVGGFHAVWSVGAQQIQNAAWLLVDEGNPFIKRPKACMFEHNGQRQTVTLDWVRIKRENLLPRIKNGVGAGAAGFGVRRSGAGYWIALQDLQSDRAREVLAAVENQKEALRAAPFVVLDLRGNGGGSSLMGRDIAASLMGKTAVDARLSPQEDTCGGPDGAWRASEGNMKHLEFLKTVPLIARGSPEMLKMVQDTLNNVREARAKGREFSGPIRCAPMPEKPANASLPPSAMKGRLILLTDNLCFSSCLAVTDDFRTLGAFHIGQTTDAATHFVDVREQWLTSGYAMFSTLQSLAPDAPVQVGPYEPALLYNGDIGDTPTLEAWVIGTAVPAAAKQADRECRDELVIARDEHDDSPRHRGCATVRLNRHRAAAMT